MPARFCARKLIEEFEPGGDVDFISLPYRSKQRRSSRYAFINFTSEGAAKRFQKRWHGTPLIAGGEGLAIGVAKTQGLAANLFLHVEERSDGQTSRPLVFRNGHEVDPAEEWGRIRVGLTLDEWNDVKAQALKSKVRQSQGAPPARSSIVGTGNVSTRAVFNL